MYKNIISSFVILLISIASFGQSMVTDSTKTKVIELAKVSNEYYQDGNYDNAIEILNEALVLDPNNYYLFFLRAKSYYVLGDLDLALSSINRSQDINSNDSEVYYISSLIHQSRMEAEQAMDQILKASKIQPDNKDYSQLIAMLSLELGKYDQAIEMAEIIKKESHQEFAALFILANANYHLENYDKCLEYCNEAIQKNNMVIDFYKLKGNTHYILNQSRDAVKAYENALALDPNSLINFENWTIALHKLNNRNTDIDYSNFTPRIHTINSSRLEDLYNQTQKKKNNFYHKTLIKRFNNSFSILSLEDFLMLYIGETIQLDNERYIAVQNDFNRMITNKMNEEQYEEALKACEKMMKKYPSFTEGYYYAAVISQKQGSLDKARSYYYKYYSLKNAIAASGDGLTFQTAYIALTNTDQRELLNKLRIYALETSTQIIDNNRYNVITYRDKNEDVQSLWINTGLVSL